MIVSPAGAEWILRSLENNPGDYIFFDIFIHRMLTTLANEQKKHGKGIYTSRKKGYAFVSDYLEMESSTDYAIEGTGEYQKAVRSTPIQYINTEPEPQTEVKGDVLSDKLRVVLGSAAPKESPASPPNEDVSSQLAGKLGSVLSGGL